MKANEYEYKEKDRRLKQFYNSVNNNEMMTELIQELAMVMKTNEITSEQLLALVRRVKVQRTQRLLMEDTKDDKVQCHEKG